MSREIQSSTLPRDGKAELYLATSQYNKQVRKSVCYVSVQKGRRRKEVQEAIAIGLLRSRLY